MDEADVGEGPTAAASHRESRDLSSTLCSSVSPVVKVFEATRTRKP